MTGWNLPPGCTQAMIDRAFGGDEDESEFECSACEDLGYEVDAIEGTIYCPWFSTPRTLDDMIDEAEAEG